LVRCQALPTVERVLSREVVDAVVVDARPGHVEQIVRLVRSYPGIPVFTLSEFRPADGPLLVAWRRAGVRILQSGVEDPVSGEAVAACAATRRWRSALREVPGLLRLTEPLQRRAWDEVLLRVGTPTRTADIARQFSVTREHLSREFAAGGAPNLKRVIDLARVLCAADLLANPGYNITVVGRVLRFASTSHLVASVRRVAGVTPAELGPLGARQVVARFLKGRTRSRL
jgi:AraC-like DNA-binding protein